VGIRAVYRGVKRPGYGVDPYLRLGPKLIIIIIIIIIIRGSLYLYPFSVLHTACYGVTFAIML